MYLTYEEYQKLGGKLDEANFTDLQFEASTQIDYYTFGRLRNDAYEDLNYEVKYCTYKLIQLIRDLQEASCLAQEEAEEDASSNVIPDEPEIIQPTEPGLEQLAEIASVQKRVSATISSQSNDGVSISYNVMSARDAVEQLKEQISSTIRRYLEYVKNSKGRKVLYRGVYPGE